MPISTFQVTSPIIHNHSHRILLAIVSSQQPSLRRFPRRAFVSWSMDCPDEGIFTALNQCRPCLIQFLIIHFCPEHLCTTNRRPKLASLDISTSKHRPVSRLMIGPFCKEGRQKCPEIACVELVSYSEEKPENTHTQN